MVNACLICVILDYYFPFPTFPAEVAPLVPYKAKKECQYQNIYGGYFATFVIEGRTIRYNLKIRCGSRSHGKIHCSLSSTLYFNQFIGKMHLCIKTCKSEHFVNTRNRYIFTTFLQNETF